MTLLTVTEYVSQLTTDMFRLYAMPGTFFIQDFYHCNHINMTGATSGAGTAYPSGAHESTPGF